MNLFHYIFLLAGLIVGGVYLVSLSGRKALREENEKLRQALQDALKNKPH